MRQMRISRIAGGPKKGTFGVVVIDAAPFCVCLEPYSRDNARNVSCIPSGQYLCVRHDSPRYGWTFMVTDVYGRKYVLFHSGNIAKDSQACILLAEHYGKLRGRFAVKNSGNTFKKFMWIMRGENQFILTITDCY